MRLLYFSLLFSACLFVACRQNSGADSASTKDTTAHPQLVDSLTGAPVRQPNPWRDAGCDLITQDEVIQLFSVDVQRDAYNEHSAAGQGYCLRAWNKADWAARDNASSKGKVAISPRNTLVTQVLDYGTEEMSRRQFDLVLKTRGDVYGEQVPGLGDGAVWSNSTTTLLVKKGSLCLQLTLDWADNPHDNLEKAKQVAAVALKKMK